MERLTKFFTSLGGVLTSLAAVIGGVVALYLAFGGGNDKAATGSNPPAAVATTSSASLEDWRTQVEDVCREADRRGKQLGPTPTDQPGQVEYVREAIPILESFTNQVRAIDEPSQIQADVARLLDKMDQTTEAAQTLVNSYQAGDLDTAEKARLELQGVSADTDRAMADLGLQGCVTFS